jgi:hypothetical protein
MVKKPAPGRATMPAGDQKSDWKDSKPIIAIIAGAAAIGATSAAFLTFYLPAHDANLATQIKILEAAHGETDKKLAAKEKELSDATAAKGRLEVEMRAVQSELASARQAHLFALGDPYPSGLRGVHVGVDISEVQRTFPKARVDRSTDGMMVVKSPLDVFSKVSYFFDTDAQDKRITHIVFEIERVKDFDDSFLLGKLRDALGAPRPGSKPMQCAWSKQKTYNVYMGEPHSFMIAIDDVKPQAWKPGPPNSDACALQRADKPAR